MFRTILAALAASWLATTSLAAEDKPAQGKKIVLIGHAPDHPYRTHCYLPDCELLAKCLRQTPGVETVVSRGWPEDPAVLADADAVVLHVQRGGDLLFDPKHRDRAAELLKRGIGLTAVHWGTGCDEESRGPHWLDALGGHFALKFSKYLVHKTSLRPGKADHPVARGWREFELTDEFYINLKFTDKATPAAVANIDGQDYPIGWTYERPENNGGRSFGFVAGHFHDNFGLEPFRRLVVNGILWTARVEIPETGASCDIDKQDLALPEEFERLKPKQ